jgi:hypothetical protein
MGVKKTFNKGGLISESLSPWSFPLTNVQHILLNQSHDKL